MTCMDHWTNILFSSCPLLLCPILNLFCPVLSYPCLSCHVLPSTTHRLSTFSGQWPNMGQSPAEHIDETNKCPFVPMSPCISQDFDPFESIPCFFLLVITIKQVRVAGVADHILPLGDWLLFFGFIHLLGFSFFYLFGPTLSLFLCPTPLGAAAPKHTAANLQFCAHLGLSRPNYVHR